MCATREHERGFQPKEKDWTETRKQFDKVLSQFSWLTPVAAELFGGRFDPARLTFPYNLIPGLKRMPVNDIRLGHYSAKYFRRARAALEHAGRHTAVTMRE